jgi:hypothetical protein
MKRIVPLVAVCAEVAAEHDPRTGQDEVGG